MVKLSSSYNLDGDLLCITALQISLMGIVVAFSSLLFLERSSLKNFKWEVASLGASKIGMLTYPFHSNFKNLINVCLSLDNLTAPPSEGMVVMDGKGELGVNSLLRSSHLFLQKLEWMHDPWGWIQVALLDAL